MRSRPKNLASAAKLCFLAARQDRAQSEALRISEIVEHVVGVSPVAVDKVRRIGGVGLEHEPAAEHAGQVCVRLRCEGLQRRRKLAPSHVQKYFVSLKSGNLLHNSLLHFERLRGGSLDERQRAFLGVGNELSALGRGFLFADVARSRSLLGLFNGRAQHTFEALFEVSEQGFLFFTFTFAPAGRVVVVAVAPRAFPRGMRHVRERGSACVLVVRVCV